MGKGPNLAQVIADKKLNEKAIDDDITARVALMKNSDVEAKAYINLNTDGIILGADNGSPEIVFTNNKYHCKFSDEYSLGALDSIIDGIINTAKDGFKVYATEGADLDAVQNLVADIGGLIKAGLALASNNSTTTQELAITFSQFMVGKKSFAVYNAINSYNMGADNAWGNKQLIVIAQITMIARVKTDPNLQLEEMYNGDLQFLIDLKDQYHKAANVKNRPKLSDYTDSDKFDKAIKEFNDTLAYVIGQINIANDAIGKDREALAGRKLSNDSIVKKREAFASL